MMTVMLVMMVVVMVMLVRPMMTFPIYFLGSIVMMMVLF